MLKIYTFVAKRRGKYLHFYHKSCLRIKDTWVNSAHLRITRGLINRIRTSLVTKALIRYENSAYHGRLRGGIGISFGDVQRHGAKRKSQNAAFQCLLGIYVGIRYIPRHRSYPSRSRRWMLEDILYSKRVVTLVWFNSKNTLEGGRSIFLPRRGKLAMLVLITWPCVYTCMHAHAHIQTYAWMHSRWRTYESGVTTGSWWVYTSIREKSHNNDRVASKSISPQNLNCEKKRKFIWFRISRLQETV